MPGGAILQLTAHGAQDIYLTGNPQITFFKVVYRRYTNFAIESVELPSINNVKMGNRYTVNIDKQGDLLGAIYLQIKVDNPNIVQTYYGFQLIDNIELLIGNQLIDKQYGEWMALWCDLTHPYDKGQMLDDMLAFSESYIYVPLQFWFCRNPGLALPLLALQYHNIYINISFKNRLSVIGQADIEDFKIIADYIYLDTDERRRFLQIEHEYLIEQVQFNESHLLSLDDKHFDMDLYFSHPVKEIFWGILDISGEYYNIEYYEEAKQILVQMNYQDRLTIRDGKYFSRVQRYQHHSGSGAQSGPPYIHVYSFALKPEEFQPSGSCNFSRLDSPMLHIEFKDSPFIEGSTHRKINVYAMNYNILKITNGMGGLAYTN
jgi:hypothetical protein